MKRHKILVPLDGSELSEQIMAHVRSLFAPEDSEIVLMRVISHWEGVTGEPLWVASAGLTTPIHISAALTTSSSSREDAEAWEDFHMVVKDSLGRLFTPLEDAGYSVTIAVHFGEPVDEIVAFAQNQGVDLIAMATHGRTGLGRLVMGSVAEAVMRQASVPVLMVRPFA